MGNDTTIVGEVIRVLNISEKGKVNLIATTLLDGKKYKTVSDLQATLGISRRSVFYWLKQLNVTLQEMGLDSTQHLPRGGYFLTQPTIDELQKYIQKDAYPELSVGDRRHVLVWLLIQREDHLSLNKLANKLHVSKKTIIKDFKELGENLPLDTEIVNTSHGKELVGSELSQRRWVYQYLEQRDPIILEETGKLPLVKSIKQRIIDFQVSIGNYYSGDAAQTLILYISWLIDRLKHHKKYLHQENEFPMDDVAVGTQKLLTTYVTVNSSEIGSLRKLLLAGQLQHVNPGGTIAKQLLEITKKIARRFSSVSGVDIVTKPFLEALTTHLYSTYYRIKYNIQYHNNTLDSVRVEYSYLMNLTKYALKPFEKFMGVPVSSDELALIVVYFGGEVKRISPEWMSSKQQPDVVLVCTSGIGTSLLLFQQLVSRYPGVRFSQPISLYEFREYNLSRNRPKLVLTTTKIQEHLSVPMLAVRAIPSQTDFQRLDHTLQSLGLVGLSKETRTVHAVLDIITDYARVDDFSGLSNSLADYFEKKPETVETVRPSLMELLPLNHIQVVNRFDNWQRAVTAALAPLSEDGSIEPGYVKSIIDITDDKGPYMVVKDGVMLAHATPEDGANTLSMSLLLLKQPVDLIAQSEVRPLKIILGLAPIDRDSHVHALSQLLTLLQDKTLYTQLTQCSTPEDILNVIEKTSNQ
ncbi:PTS sugar transporter subunit IIA [Levilactobacillus namurensis]|uniref:BglG family transcription antiterminator n=1 Tax=Levilactobacillus namurensis TaxID=380393 RepID=UPI0028B8EF51|nr:PTS sugar transporter subunit IIA [Levilactobacillus namurensis]MCW3779214.1 PTS sugar transporter subunit IIA [Levilactobacillus namurensis]MDT7019957.1 PTS sugar transporter subunit IIA [Levilactobacillus namurensis]